MDSYGGPRGPAGISGSLSRERPPGQRADRRQDERADRAPVVQGVRVAAAFGGEPANGDASRGQVQQYGRHLAEDQPGLVWSGSEAAHHAGGVEPLPPGRQLVTAADSGIQRREGSAPGSRQICPFAVQIPERTGQASYRFSPPGAAPLSRRILSTSVSDTDSDVPERAARPVSRSTARLCSSEAAGKVTVPVSGRPASSLTRARRTSHATGSPPSRRCSLSSTLVTRPRFQPADAPARPTATA